MSDKDLRIPLYLIFYSKKFGALGASLSFNTMSFAEILNDSGSLGGLSQCKTGSKSDIYHLHLHVGACEQSSMSYM